MIGPRGGTVARENIIGILSQFRGGLKLGQIVNEFNCSSDRELKYPSIVKQVKRLVDQGIIFESKPDSYALVKDQKLF
jgi:hypothetical protein